MNKLDKSLKADRQYLPLKPTLVFSVILVIALTALGIGLPIYITSKNSIEKLWEDLGSQIGSSSAARSLRYLHNAINLTNYWYLQAENNQIDFNNNQKLLDLELAAVQSNQFIKWVSFSKVDGTYVASYKILNDPLGYGTIRTIDSTAQDKKLQTTIEDFIYQDNRWKKINNYKGDYDPRTRPFWIKEGSGSWTDPYRVKLNNEPAVAYSKPQFINNELVGVWSVEFHIKELNDFLNSIKIKFGGDVLFVAGDGTIVASSIGNFFNTQVNSLEFEKNLHEANNVVQDIWQQSLTDEDRILNLNKDGFFAHIEPFFTGDIPWFVITIVPEEKFLGSLNHQMTITIALGVLLSIFFALLAALFFGHISKRLKSIAEELDLIGKFKFSNITFSNKPSFVKEVSMMNRSTDKMKVGLNSFSKYVPVNLVRELLKSGQPAKLSAKKAHMTVLFSDIVNFTTLSEKISPEELIEILGSYLETMSLIIQEKRGEVDKYIGDSIMAIFGAPLPLEDHAMQACLSALEMRKKLNELNTQWAFENKPILEQKIGINTGSMIVGNIGSVNRFEYTVIGDNVNLASRLEGLNKFYGTKILVGEETALLTKDRLLLRPLDFVAVKGKENAHLIYELIDIKDKNTDLIDDIIENSIKALELYKNREFAKAKILFEQCYKNLGSLDYASKAMIDKCSFYIKEPPDKNWSGATIMSQK